MSNCVYLYRNNNSNKYKLSIKAAEKSKIIKSLILQNKKNIDKKDDPKSLDFINIEVKEGTEESLLFVFKYLQFYENQIEITNPEHPLINTPLKELFEFEKVIFGNLLIVTSIEETKEKIKYIKNLIDTAAYLGMEILLKKLSAIMAFYISKIDIIEIEQIL